jgi:hypothetical protein
MTGRGNSRRRRAYSARGHALATERPTPRRARDIPAVVVPDEPDRVLTEAPDEPMAPRTRGAEPATKPDPAPSVTGAS